MKVRKAWIGSEKAATLGNLAELQEDIHLDLQEIGQKMVTKGDLTQMEERMDKKFATKQDLKEAVKGLMSRDTGEELLEYMKSIDKRLRNWDWIPEAVTDLKNRVFKLEIKTKN